MFSIKIIDKFTHNDIANTSDLCLPPPLWRDGIGVSDEIENNLEISCLNFRKVIFRNIIYKSYNV